MVKVWHYRGAACTKSDIRQYSGRLSVLSAQAERDLFTVFVLDLTAATVNVC